MNNFRFVVLSFKSGELMEAVINGLNFGVIMVKTHILQRGSDNALDLESLANALSDFYTDRSRLSRLWEDMEMLTSYLDFIAGIAKQVNLSESVVYYPFGGVDVKHPFLMVDSVRDVFSQGMERFGSIKSLENFMKYASNYDKSATGSLNWNFGGYLRFLETGDRQVYSGWTFPGTDGVGGLAVADIASVLKGKIVGIHYFEIDDKGKPVFISTADLQRDRSYDNAVIQFRDASRKIRRFWYSKYFFNGDSPDKERFRSYIDEMNFDILFIKGALSIFAEEEPEKRAELFDLHRNLTT